MIEMTDDVIDDGKGEVCLRQSMPKAKYAFRFMIHLVLSRRRLAMLDVCACLFHRTSRLDSRCVGLAKGIPNLGRFI